MQHQLCDWTGQLRTGEVSWGHDVVVKVPLDQDPGDPLVLSALLVCERTHHLQQGMLGVKTPSDCIAYLRRH